MSVLYRAHEWLADHCRWVQYPAPRARLVSEAAPFFATPMPWWLRFTLLVVGAVLVIVAAVVIAALGLLFFSAIRA